MIGSEDGSAPNSAAVRPCAANGTSVEVSRHVANDPDPLEPEPVGDGGAGALEERAGAELPARERAGECVECLELDVRRARDGNPILWSPQTLLNVPPQPRASVAPPCFAFKRGI